MISQGGAYRSLYFSEAKKICHSEAHWVEQRSVYVWRLQARWVVDCHHNRAAPTGWSAEERMCTKQTYRPNRFKCTIYWPLFWGIHIALLHFCYYNVYSVMLIDYPTLSSLSRDHSVGYVCAIIQWKCKTLGFEPFFSLCSNPFLL